MPDPVLRTAIEVSLGLPTTGYQLTLADAANLTNANDGPLVWAIGSSPGTSEIQTFEGLEDATGVTQLQDLDLSAATNDLGLENITYVQYLNLDQTNMTTLSMPSLATVGYIGGGSNSLTALSLPDLSTATEGLGLGGFAALTSIFLPDLASDAGSFDASYNTDLASIDLPLLTTVGNFSLNVDPLLATVNVPSLVSVTGSLTVSVNSGSGTDVLQSLSFPALTTIGTPSTPQYLNFYDNLSLQSASFPVLRNVYSYAQFAEDPALDLGANGFPELGSLPNISVYNMDPSFVLPTSIQALIASGATVNQS